ncbi:MAG: HlyD family secretion protein [Acidobacteriaceae bacterium]|jgi:HlyD family secretion protein
MNPRNRVLILLSTICVISLVYYLFSTPRSKDWVLIGTVDANQVIVSPQVQGRITKLLVDEGTQVKQGDVIAILDPAELEAGARAAAATIEGLKSKVSETQASERAMQGSTSSNVANAKARLESARAQLAQAEATLQRTESDSRRIIALAKQGITSDQDRVQAESNLKAQQSLVESLKQQVSAAEADVTAAQANTNQANAARSTVQSTRGQLQNSEAMLKQAEVRLGYTRIFAPVSGTISVRAAREGEVLNPGQPIVTIVDFSDTWVRAAIPETNADHIGLGDTLPVRLPGGTVVNGKVFFKSPEADFATQRDVGRRKRDIKTIVLKVRLDNPNGAYVPGMTAEVLVSPYHLAAPSQHAATGQTR